MKGLKVFFACFFGAGIGSLIALQSSGSGWMVVLGLLAGGLGGYLAYEYQEMWSAVKRAYVLTIAWRPNPSKLKKLGIDMAFVFAVAVPYMFLFFYILGAAELPKLGIGAYTVAILKLMTTILSILSVVGGGVEIMKLSEGEENNTLEKDGERVKGWIRKYNVAKVASVVMKAAIMSPVVIWLLLREIFEDRKMIALGAERMLKNVAMFFWRAFKFMHSDIRLLCGIDALIGSYAGYVLGNAFVGALIGGAWGAFNYYVVSIKLLHLDKAPAKS
jgi:hypothetical protein